MKPMQRWFNTTGPCDPEIHYMLPPEQRLPEVPRLIDQRHYFVLHAPRQAGKTTALTALANKLTEAGTYAAVLLSMEVGAPFSSAPGVAEEAVLGAWRRAAEATLPPSLQPPNWPQAAPGQRIAAALTAWAKDCPRPLVVFLDEIDALRAEALLSVLRQLREGFRFRPHAFPWSLALVGLRDVRDYKSNPEGDSPLGTSSPFNIKADSLTLSDFSRDELATLYRQHTGDTGQTFVETAIDHAYSLTQGQPWLVNALARQVTEHIVPDRKQAIETKHINMAKEQLIKRQDTHLDSLAERLREPRVRSIIEPILAGATFPNVPADDVRFVQDLGLVRASDHGGLVIANPIYQEVIPTALAYVTRASLPETKPTWLRPDGRLDPRQLLTAFLSFWKQYGAALLGSAPYPEVAPHLVMMAFLHRVVNGGGSLEREYAIGRGRMDLCVRYGPDTLAIELKVWRDGRPDPKQEGLEQLDRYLSGLGLQSGWLVIFDRRSDQPPIEERARFEQEKTKMGKEATVIYA